MTIEEQLQDRSNNTCELCGSENSLSVYAVPPDRGPGAESSLYVCEKCMNQLEKKEDLDSAHWLCLRDSMWSEVQAVQVVAWRIDRKSVV
jgi:protein PhnA